MDAAKPGAFFITFEGPEGGGKSTQASRLAKRLSLEGIPAAATREPGGTELGERVRHILLAPGGSPLSSWAEALLFTAARAQLVAEVISPALNAGKVVICDRYIDSTLAYQGFGRGLDLDQLRRLQEAATGGLRPELTLLLDLKVEEGLARIPGGARDRLDRETEQFHHRVREGYLQMAAQDPGRWVKVDAAGAPDGVAEKIFNVAVQRLKGAGIPLPNPPPRAGEGNVRKSA
jgi:dTMP kinase